MSITRLDVSLERFEVGLSGAVPKRSDWSEPAMDRGILEFVSLLSSIIFKYGGRVVHGAHPALTPVILHRARLHAADRPRRPITLVVSNLWARDWDKSEIDELTDIAEVVITEQVGTGPADDADTRNASLTAMRKVLIDCQNVMVAVGGKMHSGDGFVPGIGEELQLAAERGVPRFLVGGLGGFAQEFAKKLIPASLNNTLTDAENAQLFGSSDVSACVNEIFECLAQSQELASPESKPIKWNPGLRTIIDHRDGSVCEDSAKHIMIAHSF